MNKYDSMKCSNCEKMYPIAQISKRQQLCNGCRSTLPAQDCEYCRIPFQSSKQSAACRSCEKRYARDGAPTACQCCGCNCVFGGGSPTCSMCKSQTEKYGPPHPCGDCGRQAAFRKEIGMPVLGEKLRCNVCKSQRAAAAKTKRVGGNKRKLQSTDGGGRAALAAGGSAHGSSTDGNQGGSKCMSEKVGLHNQLDLSKKERDKLQKALKEKTKEAASNQSQLKAERENNITEMAKVTRDHKKHLSDLRDEIISLKKKLLSNKPTPTVFRSSMASAASSARGAFGGKINMSRTLSGGDKKSHGGGSNSSGGGGANTKKSGGGGKDPNKPKGSLSAYILFGQDERPKLAEKYPNLKQTEYMSKIGELHAIEPERKGKYAAKAKVLKAEYEQKMKIYNAGLASSRGAAANSSSSSGGGSGGSSRGKAAAASSGSSSNASRRKPTAGKTSANASSSAKPAAALKKTGDVGAAPAATKRKGKASALSNETIDSDDDNDDCDGGVVIVKKENLKEASASTKAVAVKEEVAVKKEGAKETPAPNAAVASAFKVTGNDDEMEMEVEDMDKNEVANRTSSKGESKNAKGGVGDAKIEEAAAIAPAHVPAPSAASAAAPAAAAAFDESSSDDDDDDLAARQQKMKEKKKNGASPSKKAQTIESDSDDD
eukprot:gene5673-18612_t